MSDLRDGFVHDREPHRRAVAKVPDATMLLTAGRDCISHYAVCWADLIEPVGQAPWDTTDRVTGRDIELCNARVAMVAAVYYRPTNR